MAPLVGYSRGRVAEWDGAVWRHPETGLLAEASGGPAQPCPRCAALPTADGPDPCLGMIPGATGACCGHGVHRGYVTWESIGVGPEWWQRAYLRPEA